MYMYDYVLYCTVLRGATVEYCFTGPWHEIFEFFLIIELSLGPWYTRGKVFLNIAAHLRSKSTKLVAQRCQWHCCVHMLSGVNDTAVHIKAVAIAPVCNQLCLKFLWMILNTKYCFLCGKMIRLHTAQRCNWHSVICTAVSLTLCYMHSGVIDTLLYAQRCHWHSVICTEVSLTLCYMHSGVIDTLLYAQRCHWHSVICTAVSLTLCYMHSSVIDTLLYAQQCHWHSVICTEVSLTRLYAQRCHWHSVICTAVSLTPL
jgi:hypothetical protein